MNILRKLFVIILSVSIIAPSKQVMAAEEVNIVAKSAVLLDIETGKKLFGKNESSRMYPGSMTKILTAMVLLDYFNTNEYVTLDSAVNNAPVGSSTAGNFEGETLTVHNLLRALLIASGNETACAIASLTAKRAANNDELRYSEAEKWFAEKMNEKAREAGAIDTNFVNPHGFQDARHYTTAMDMASITLMALKDSIISEIAREVSFSGNGAGDTVREEWQTMEHTWKTHNELIDPAAVNYYPYATGLKTGFHDEAGYCVAASAVKSGRSLVAIVMFSTEDGRGRDAAALFDYGFNNFSVHEIINGEVALGEIAVSNPRLGASDSIEYAAMDKFSELLSDEQFAEIVTEVTILPELLAPPVIDETTGKRDTTPRILTPIAEDDVIGYIEYLLDGNLLHRADVFAKNAALERTFNSDADYYVEIWKKRAISPYAVPIYTGIILIIILIAKLASSSRNKKSRGYGRRY